MQSDTMYQMSFETYSYAYELSPLKVYIDEEEHRAK